MSIIQNVTKTINYGRKNGYKEAMYAVMERVTNKYHADYQYVEPSEEELEQQSADWECVNEKISLLVPAYETKPEYLCALVESCINQTYGNWELIIADASASDIVANTLKTYSDERIRYIKLEENGGISENTNQALSYATGDYCGLIDHDDLITKDALYEVVKKLHEAKQQGHEPIMIYTDEDKCDEHALHFFDPHIKMDFNLDLILTNNYICHFLLIKTEVLQKLQIRKQYDGAQDFDLVLRIVSSLLLREREGSQGMVEGYILHVPKILYHWRCHQGSTAENPQSKMYAYEAGRKALADFTKRMGWKADIRHNKHLGFYRIAYRNPVLQHREDLAAVGGFVVSKGRVASGPYKGQPLVYAGYMNRMDLYQNIPLLDIRNLAVNKNYYDVYEKVTGHSYESTFAQEKAEQLPQWIQDLSKEELERLNRQLSKQLRSSGARLLLDPESVRKIS